MVPVIVESSKPVLDKSPEIKALSSSAVIGRFISCSVVAPKSSVTSTEKESLPLKLELGVFVHLPVAAAIVAAPLVEFLPEAIEKIEASVRPYGSVAYIVPVIVESSKPVLDRSPEIKALSSSAVIVRFISCSVVAPKSSVTSTEKESLPLKLELGVNVHLPVAAAIVAAPLVEFLPDAIE